MCEAVEFSYISFEVPECSGILCKSLTLLRVGILIQNIAGLNQMFSKTSLCSMILS